MVSNKLQVNFSKHSYILKTGEISWVKINNANESKYDHQFFISVTSELSFHIGMPKFAHIFNHLRTPKEISLQKIHCRRVTNGKRIT